MSASVAISSAALANSAAANAVAHAAQEAACVALVQNYKADGATVAEMRAYSDCINVLHPEQMSDGSVMALKAAVILCFACSAFAVWREKKSGHMDWFDTVAIALVGFIVGVLLSAAIALLIWVVA